MKTYTMKELPIGERPYEKLLNYGESSLSNAELLAIILKTGTREQTSLEVAQNILMLDNEHSLSSISKLEIQELTKIRGIGTVKAIQIKAVLELAKRIARPQEQKNVKVTNARIVHDLLKYICINETKEKLYVLSLNVKNEIIKTTMLANGGSAKVAIDMKEVFSEPLKLLANGIILVHNHPSGDTTPSKADITFTYKVAESCKILAIEFIDHIVISLDNYTSLKDRGII